MKIIGSGLSIGNDEAGPMAQGQGDEAGHRPDGKGSPQNEKEIGLGHLPLRHLEVRGKGLAEEDHIGLDKATAGAPG